MAWTEKYCDSAAGGGGDGSSGSPWTLTEALANVAINERINIKGTHTLSALASVATNGSSPTNTWGCSMRGYTTTIGDGGKATIDGGTSYQMQVQATASGWLFENLIVTASGAGINGAMETNATQGFYLNCDFEYTGTAAKAAFCIFNNKTSNKFWGCTFKNTTSSTGCALQASDGAQLYYCTARSGNHGFYIPDPGAHVHAVGCLAVGSGTTGSRGFSFHGSSTVHGTIIGNTVYNFHYGFYGYALDASNPLTIANNITYTVLYGIYLELASTESALIHTNAFGLVTTNNYYQVDTAFRWNDITLTADPFTDKANDDFSLNDTAGGGAACKAAGLAAPAVP